jgi:predicted secreted hydrolase
MMRPLLLLPFLLPVLLPFLPWGCSDPTEQPPLTSITVDRALGDADVEGFTRALGPRDFSFPDDHGPHPGFKHEWWYFTGNLEDGDGRHFGYQVTFFRIALAASGQARRSAWASRHIWMAHAALSDVQGGRHLAKERFSREAIGLAGARAAPWSIWVEDWRIDRPEETGRWSIRVGTDRFELELELDELRPPLLQGDAGLSRKGAAPGNASYYYSLPRLATGGAVRIDGVRHRVQGLSWLDREWSTSALGPGQAGWDWFSLQLNDGSDLMYYRLRRKDGSTDPHSRGLVQLPDGTRVDLYPDSVHIQPLGWWTSPSGERYPTAWSLRVPGLDRDLTVEALIPAQWMDLTVRYWEGAVAARDQDGPAGYGYLEMTGY